MMAASARSSARRSLSRRLAMGAPFALAACGTAQTTPALPTPTSRPLPPTRPVPTDDPIGFAAVAPGTTGGRGGPVVTAITPDELLRHMATPAPVVIQITGTLKLCRMLNVPSNKTL